jgi:hypothetical protein
MSYTISGDLTLTGDRPINYWWPLTFEVMRRQGLTFENPWYRPERLGLYYRGENMDYIERATFRALWDDISSTALGSSVVAQFWSLDLGPDPWDICCSLKEAVPQVTTEGGTAPVMVLSCWTHSVGESGSDHTSPQAVEAASAHLTHFIEIVCDLHTLCGAVDAELEHERYGVVSRFGTIGKPLVLEWWESPAAHVAYEAPVSRVELPIGADLALVNPVPILWGGPPIPVRLPS